MNSPEKVWNIVKGIKAWDVSIMHNFWDGSMYCTGFRPFSVLAKSEVEARLLVIRNLSVVEEYFRKRRMRKGTGSIRLIRKSETYTINPTGVKAVKKSALVSGTILNTDGKWIKFNRDEF